MTVKIGSRAWMVREAFAEWIEDVEEDHAGCTVFPTCDGCEVYRDGDLVIAYMFTVEEEGR